MTDRRVYCRGNCGRWFYYDAEPKEPGRHRGGRPREWCDRCLPMHTRERKRADAPNLMSPKYAGAA